MDIYDRILKILLIIAGVVFILLGIVLLVGVGMFIPGFLDELFLLGLFLLVGNWLVNYRDASGKENFIVRELRKIALGVFCQEVVGQVVEIRDYDASFILKDQKNTYRFPLSVIKEKDRRYFDDWLGGGPEVRLKIYINFISRQVTYYEVLAF
ncbi:MAG: hypothetical protein LLG09_00470 [Negativicutes bacterium]|nr:hypothetical protein [Negativicutes bacterium]